MAANNWNPEEDEAFRLPQGASAAHNGPWTPLGPHIRSNVARGAPSFQLHPPTAASTSGSSATHDPTTGTSFVSSQDSLSSHRQASSQTSQSSQGQSQDFRKPDVPGPSRQSPHTQRIAQHVVAISGSGSRHEQAPHNQAQFHQETLTTKRLASIAGDPQIQAHTAFSEDHGVKPGAKRQFSGDSACAAPNKRHGNGKKPVVHNPIDSPVGNGASTDPVFQGIASAQAQVFQAEKQALEAGLRKAMAQWAGGVENLPSELLDILMNQTDNFAHQMHSSCYEHLASLHPIAQHSRDLPAPPAISQAGEQAVQDEQDSASVKDFCDDNYKSGCSTRDINHVKAYSCPACGAGVNNWQQYRRHNESRFPRRFYRCTPCGKIESRHIHEHCLEVHGESSRTASQRLDYNPAWAGSCEYCDLKFQGPRLETVDELLRHIWNVHIMPDYFPKEPANGPDEDQDDHEDGGNGDAEGEFDEAFEEFSERYFDYPGAGPSNSGGGNGGYSSQPSGSSYRTCSEGDKRSEGDACDRGRTGQIRTSVLRSPRINLPSRGDSFHDDENFQLDLVIIRASAYSDDDDTTKHDQHVNPKKISFDEPSATGIARSSTMRSEASSIGPISRVATMRSDGSATFVGDDDSDTDYDGSDFGCEDDACVPALELYNLERPRLSTDRSQAWAVEYYMQADSELPEQEQSERYDNSEPSTCKTHVPKAWKPKEDEEYHTKRLEQLKKETQSEWSASMARLRIRKALE